MTIELQAATGWSLTEIYCYTGDVSRLLAEDDVDDSSYYKFLEDARRHERNRLGRATTRTVTLPNLSLVITPTLCPGARRG